MNFMSVANKKAIFSTKACMHKAAFFVFHFACSWCAWAEAPWWGRWRVRRRASPRQWARTWVVWCARCSDLKAHTKVSIQRHFLAPRFANALARIACCESIWGSRWNKISASKIKLKNVNKKRMATARRLIFLEFLKASIANLIILLFSSLQNSEGCGDSNSGDSCADPRQFLSFPKTKI